MALGRPCALWGWPAHSVLAADRGRWMYLLGDCRPDGPLGRGLAPTETGGRLPFGRPKRASLGLGLGGGCPRDRVLRGRHSKTRAQPSLPEAAPWTHSCATLAPVPPQVLSTNHEPKVWHTRTTSSLDKAAGLPSGVARTCLHTPSALHHAWPHRSPLGVRQGRWAGVMHCEPPPAWRVPTGFLFCWAPVSRPGLHPEGRAGSNPTELT